MSVFALPALIALLTKMWVYALARRSKQTSQIFLWLLVFFAAHNLSEFLLISKLFNNMVSESLLKAYYVCAFFSIAYMCVFAMSVANKDNHNKHYLLTIGIAVLMSLATFQTDWIVAGVVSVGYTVTAVKGAYYFVFQLSALSSFIWILYTLIRRYLHATDTSTRLKCYYAVLALSPVIVMSVIVMIMMQMGYQYTAAILLPFSSTAFLLLVVLTERDNDLIRVRDRLPFMVKRKDKKKLISIYRAHLSGDLGLSDTKGEIERILIQNALDSSDNNVTLAANKLGITRSTLYSIFNRLNFKRHALEK